MSFGGCTFRTIDLSYNALEGSLPDSMGVLGSLQELSLSYSGLSLSSLPQFFTQFQFLEQLQLAGTSLSGDVPDFVGNYSLLDAYVPFSLCISPFIFP